MILDMAVRPSTSMGEREDSVGAASTPRGTNADDDDERGPLSLWRATDDSCPLSLWRAAYLTIPTTVTPPSASGDVATTATMIPTAPSSASGDVATATRVILPTLEGGPGDDGADFLNDGDADGEE